MIELSNSNAQTLSAGQSAVFDTVILHTGCTECYRKNSGAVNLTRKNTVYEISFSCNIGTTAADGTGEIGITLDGSPLPETIGIVSTVAGGDLNSVSGETFVKTCCCGGTNTIMLTNTGTADINVAANPRLSIKIR